MRSSARRSRDHGYGDDSRYWQRSSSPEQASVRRRGAQCVVPVAVGVAAACIGADRLDSSDRGRRDAILFGAGVALE